MNPNFSGSVVVLQDGKLVFESHKCGPNTPYPLASITKSVIASAILQLESHGKLQLGDTLKQYMPDFLNGDKITLHHLLTHTAGIWKETQGPEQLYTSDTLMSLIESIKQKPLRFEPGAKFEYSNLGFSLLAYVIECVSGQSYKSYVLDHIFTPLGMHNSRFNSEINLKGSGDLYATAQDLMAWLDWHLSKLHMAQGCIDAPFHYGYGEILVKSQEEVDYFFQDGNLPGFQSLYVHYPHRKLTFVILCDDETADLSALVNDLGWRICAESIHFRMDW